MGSTFDKIETGPEATSDANKRPDLKNFEDSPFKDLIVVPDVNKILSYRDKADKPSEVIVKAGNDPERNARALQDAIDNANGKPTIIRAEPGTYRGQIRFGKQHQNIRIEGKSDNGDRAVFDMSDYQMEKGNNAVFNLRDTKDIQISGFEIKNFQSTLKKHPAIAVLVEGSGQNITIKGNYFHHLGLAEEGSQSERDGSQAISIRGTNTSDEQSAITNLKIESNKVHDLNMGQHEAITVNGNVNGFIVAKNHISDINNIGIDIAGGFIKGQFNSARKGTIIDNYVENADSDRNRTYKKGDQSAGGIYIDGARDIDIIGNTVKSTNRGIEIGCENNGHFSYNIKVAKNILVKNQHAAITVGAGNDDPGETRDVVVQDNIFQANGSSEDLGIVIQRKVINPPKDINNAYLDRFGRVVRKQS